MIDGLSILSKIRHSGHRPQSVMLTTDGHYFRPKFAQEFKHMELVAHDSVAADDFRPFHGLTVTLFVPKWNKLATDCLDKLKAHAARINVLCAEYGEDIGYVWTRKYGAVDLSDFRWLVQFHKARSTVCRTDQETDERIRLENEAIKHFPGVLNLG